MGAAEAPLVGAVVGAWARILEHNSGVMPCFLKTVQASVQSGEAASAHSRAKGVNRVLNRLPVLNLERSHRAAVIVVVGIARWDLDVDNNVSAWI